jgi:hypothetical protein
LQLHGDAHVALDTQLALHEGGRRIEFTLRHVDKVPSFTLMVVSAAASSLETLLAAPSRWILPASPKSNFTFLPGTVTPALEKRFRISS